MRLLGAEQMGCMAGRTSSVGRNACNLSLVTRNSKDNRHRMRVQAVSVPAGVWACGGGNYGMGSHWYSRYRLRSWLQCGSIVQLQWLSSWFWLNIWR